MHWEDVKDWGLAQWARPILNVLFDAMGESIDYQLRHLLGPERYHRFQTPARHRQPPPRRRERPQHRRPDGRRRQPRARPRRGDRPPLREAGAMTRGRAAALALLLFGAVACAVFGGGGDRAVAASCTKSWVCRGQRRLDRRHASGPAAPRPSGADDVCIDVSGTYTVTLNGGQGVHALTVGSTTHRDADPRGPGHERGQHAAVAGRRLDRHRARRGHHHVDRGWLLVPRARRPHADQRGIVVRDAGFGWVRGTCAVVRS